MEDSFISLQDLIRLNGKTAIVTGGARGLGYAMCARFLEAGANVVIADLDADEGSAAVHTLANISPTVSFFRCDVSDEENVKAVVSQVAEMHGGIDILVNNAGIYPRKSFTEMTGEDFRRVTDINLTGVFLCSRYAAPVMIEKMRGGCIINIASIEGIHPSSTGMTAYDASKSGVIMLTKSLARELGRHGIRVNCVAPGGILTRALTSQLDDSETAQKAQLKELKNFLKRMALGRMGEADDIARVVLFLACGLSDYITGETIVVDGGYLIS